MESEVAAVSGYVNRPTGHVPEQRMQFHARGRHDGSRPSMRIARVALRAYEQRTERRVWLRAWMVSRLASAPVR